MTDGESTESVPMNSHSIENPRVVAAALACAWFAVGSVVLAMGLILGIVGSSSGMVLAPIIVTLMLLQIPAVIAVLVLTILGGMWQGVLDCVMAAVLVVLTVGADLMLWPLTSSRPGFGAFGNCDGSGPCTSDTDLWIGVGVQTLVLAILLVCSAHWVWRLRPEAAQQKTNRLGVLAVAALFVAALVAIDTNIDTSSSSNSSMDGSYSSGFSTSSSSAPLPAKTGQVTLSNDLGQTVRVVYCPQQDCSGQKGRIMGAGTTATFTAYSTSGSPDGFVVLTTSAGLTCGSVGTPGSGIVLLSSAGPSTDPTACDMETSTLSLPH